MNIVVFASGINQSEFSTLQTKIKQFLERWSGLGCQPRVLVLNLPKSSEGNVDRPQAVFVYGLCNFPGKDIKKLESDLGNYIKYPAVLVENSNKETVDGSGSNNNEE